MITRYPNFCMQLVMYNLNLFNKRLRLNNRKLFIWKAAGSVRDAAVTEAFLHLCIYLS